MRFCTLLRALNRFKLGFWSADSAVVTSFVTQDRLRIARLIGIAIVMMCIHTMSSQAWAAGADASTTKQASKSQQSSSSRPVSIEDEKLDSKVFGGAPEETKKSQPKPESSGAMVRLFFGLLVVLGTIFGIHYLLKKYGQGKMSAGVLGRGDAIEVMATTPLAPNRSLHLVRVGREMVLIGATEQSISRIGDVDAAMLAAQPVTGSGDFQMELQGALAGTQTRSGASSSSQQTFVQRFIHNLQMMTAR